MRALITGFGPFAGNQGNVSGELARSFDGETAGPFLVKGIEIPVRYCSIKPDIETAIAVFSPDVILCTGTARVRGIKVETVARNVVSNMRRPYNDGAMFDGQAIEDGGPERLETRLPVGSIVGALVERGIPAYASRNAGTFACNQAFYHLMYYLKKTRNDAVAGFVHVPARWNLARLRRAFLVVMDATVKGRPGFAC